MKVKTGDYIRLKIRKITIGDEWIYLTLEYPKIKYPYINYPTLRVHESKIDNVTGERKDE